MYTREDEERDERMFDHLISLSPRKQMQYLERWERDRKIEDVLSNEPRGWFQPTEIFKGWLFARVLMIALPILAILVGLFNKTLIEHGILSYANIGTITNTIIYLGVAALVYKICFKWIYKVSSWWVVSIGTAMAVFGISQLMLLNVLAFFVVFTIILGFIKFVRWIFSKKQLMYSLCKYHQIT